MGKVNIKLNGADTVVDAIRYLEENGKDFFVYTLSELDNQAYQISYVTKVENGKGIVLTEDEWNQIKELIILLNMVLLLTILLILLIFAFSFAFSIAFGTISVPVT